MVMASESTLLPVEYANEVIKEMAATSTVLGMSRRKTMSTRTTRMPATALLASAYWVGGTDSTGLKQETIAEWKGVDLIVEELACLVAIPHAYEQDSGFPVWDETRPQLVEAMGATLDAAVLFGVNKPATWGDDIITAATAAGNVRGDATGDDLAQAIAFSARDLKKTGYATTGFAAEPGFGWDLVGLRSADGHPIYQTNLAGPINRGLYNFPMMEAMNGAWDDTAATLIHGDWGKSIVGIRQDITFTRHDDGVITDSGGAVVFNAMQQDSTIWRAVMRVAWAAANPATRLGSNANGAADKDTDTAKYPFAVLTPGT